MTFTRDWIRWCALSGAVLTFAAACPAHAQTKVPIALVADAVEPVPAERGVPSLPDAPESQLSLSIDADGDQQAAQAKDAASAPATPADKPQGKATLLSVPGHGCQPAAAGAPTVAPSATQGNTVQPAGAGQPAGVPPANSATTTNAGPTADAAAASTATAGSVDCAKKPVVFRRFVDAGTTTPLTPKGKLKLAGRGVIDPFNLITIAVSSAIYVGGNSDSPYGPGMKGWAKNAGTSLTEDMTGSFFTTFLFASLAHQDPRYHRMPKASMTRRVFHCLSQPLWGQSDSGKGMVNVAYLLGIPAAVTLSNVYVPDREQGVGPTAETSAIAIGSAPIDNFITEFLPDVAKHVSVRIVLIQRVINAVAQSPGSS